jgi:1-acyl-sn-glycerol-3-phosphate acyltransferase
MTLLPELVAPRFRLAEGAAYTLYMSQRAMLEKALGKSDDRVRELTKMWAAGMRARMGIEVRSFGFESIDWTKPYVVMANHQSYLDVLALFSALPKTFGVVAKRELFYIPFFSGVMRAIGCVSVDRKKKTESLAAMKEAAAQVRSGTTIAVFPEGTRSRGDHVGKMKKGSFYLAQEAQVPALPLGIRGSHALMPRENTGIRPGVIEIYAGAPVAPPKHGSSAGRAAFMANVRSEIARLAGVPEID